MVKLLRSGEGEVGIQLVRRGDVAGIVPTTFPGDDHANLLDIQERVGVLAVMALDSSG